MARGSWRPGGHTASPVLSWNDAVGGLPTVAVLGPESFARRLPAPRLPLRCPTARAARAAIPAESLPPPSSVGRARRIDAGCARGKARTEPLDGRFRPCPSDRHLARGLPAKAHVVRRSSGCRQLHKEERALRSLLLRMAGSESLQNGQAVERRQPVEVEESLTRDRAERGNAAGHED